MEFFFGKAVNPNEEQKKIEEALRKYQNETASEELKKKIYTELSILKEKGVITIPFQVIFRKEIFDKHRPYIEILLDTKV